MPTQLHDRLQPPRLVLCRFDGVTGARDALAEIRAVGELEGLSLQAEALVSREANGTAHLHDPGAAVAGATAVSAATGVLAFLAGPVALPALMVAGALFGGIAGHVAGRLLPGADLRRVAEMLPPDSSAWIALADPADAEDAARVLRRWGAVIHEVPVGFETGASMHASLRRLAADAGEGPASAAARPRPHTA